MGVCTYGYSVLSYPIMYIPLNTFVYIIYSCNKQWRIYASMYLSTTLFIITLAYVVYKITCTWSVYTFNCGYSSSMVHNFDLQTVSVEEVSVTVHYLWTAVVCVKLV